MKNLKCNKIDKYYTRAHVVNNCINLLIKEFKIYDLVIEPSAGNGAFLKQIPHKNKIGLDLHPDDPIIKKKDWFKFKINKKYKNVLIMGNPPFGYKHKLSDAFIKHSLTFKNVKTIAFILPNTYRKHTRQKILPPEWRIKKIMELDKNSFIYEDRIVHEPCSFFIFDKSKGVDLRFDTKKYEKHKDFEFSNKNDFDFFMFGASPKKIIKNPKKNNRGYYIKSKIELNELINKFKKIKWKGNSCANGGVAWFTKVEIIKNYDLFLSFSK